jgi:hypothetical protein
MSANLGSIKGRGMLRRNLLASAGAAALGVALTGAGPTPAMAIDCTVPPNIFIFGTAGEDNAEMACRRHHSEAVSRPQL